MNTRRAILAALLALVASGCAPTRPDASLIFWEQPSPQLAAQAHARERAGLIAFVVLPTGSMEPFITGGDYVVVDMNASFASIQAGEVLIYQANWLPKSSPPACHMAAAKHGDGWIMDGIANRHYENGKMTMMPEDYRGKVIAIYTTRKKV
jgi:signal peptidase I